MLPPEPPFGASASAVASTEIHPELDWVAVWQGPRTRCRDLALVLEAAALPYAFTERGAEFALLTPASQAALVRSEIGHYLREPGRAATPARPPSFRGVAAGAIGYGLVLLAVAYCAGIRLFGVDWLDLGSVTADPGSRGEWWRAITALTLHLTPEHLFGNLLFGIGAGVLLARLIGPGVAWLSILASGASANLLELLIAPAGYSAVGASTAVFAALGILAGYAWRRQLGLRERWIYRVTPVAAGVALLALLGAGNIHVDVLGHLLGFLCGLALGSVYAFARLPRSGAAGPQAVAAAAAIALVGVAWALALRGALG